MTIICALHDPEHGCTWIGSDRDVLCGTIWMPAPPKWDLHHGWAAGACGWSRVQNLINGARDKLFVDLPGPFEFTARLRAVLEAEGWKHGPGDGKAGPPDFEINLLLASPDGIWGIDGTFGFDPTPPGVLIADGAGRDVAFGAAYAAKKAGLNAHDTLVTSIEAAVKLERGCSGETWVHKLEKT